MKNRINVILALRKDAKFKDIEEKYYDNLIRKWQISSFKENMLSSDSNNIAIWSVLNSLKNKIGDFPLQENLEETL